MADRVPQPDPRTASKWLRAALASAAGLDPVDLANDAEYLHALLRQQADDHAAFVQAPVRARARAHFAALLAGVAADCHPREDAS